MSHSSMLMNNIVSNFGNIDIYLFDQLLKGRFDDCKDIIDVGCGNGRNIIYFLKNGYHVSGIDRDANAIDTVRQLSAGLSHTDPHNSFKVAAAEDMPFPPASFDLAICSAVLHFANDNAHFSAMLHAIWSVLRPGGYFFARLASDIGIEHLVKPLGNGRYLLPDGSTRYLVNEAMLMDYTLKLNGQLYEPIKTTNVSNIRCMTTWCIRKQ